jgi:hypothetical protein
VGDQEKVGEAGAEVTPVTPVTDWQEEGYPTCWEEYPFSEIRRCYLKLAGVVLESDLRPLLADLLGALGEVFPDLRETEQRCSVKASWCFAGEEPAYTWQRCLLAPGHEGGCRFEEGE